MFGFLLFVVIRRDTLLQMKKLTALRLEPKQLKELSKIGKRLDRTTSYLIRRAVDEFIKKEKR